MFSPLILGIIASSEGAPGLVSHFASAIFAARADDVTGTGSDVTAWPDQSGASNDATGVSVTDYPQLDVVTFGRPVIVATANQGYFTLPSSIATAILKGNDLPWTIAGVTYSNNGDELLGFGGSPGVDPIIRIRHASGSRLQVNKEADVTSFANAFSTGVFTDNTWHAWCVRCNGTTVDIWIDSTTIDTTAAALDVDDCSAAATDGTIFRRPGASTQGQMSSWTAISSVAEDTSAIEAQMAAMIAWVAGM